MTTAHVINTSISTRTRLRSITGGAMGNLVEWYDWYAYTFFALYFSPQFFPKSSTTAQLLHTAGIFAVGFFMRPVGGWIFGSLADRRGRKTSMTLSVLLMCFGSLLIACIPSYQRIGIWAPALLFTARLLQGLSVGGEYGTSATYLSEMAAPHRRGFFSSFQYVTLIGGQITAVALLLLLQAILTREQLNEWGWRIPFLFGACLAIVAFYLRRNLREPEQFHKAPGSNKRQGRIRELLRYPRAILTVIGLTLGGTIAFYTFSVYMPKYLENTAGMTREIATRISFAALVVFMFLQPFFGWLSDRVGRKPLLIAFGVGGTLFTVPLLAAIGRATAPLPALGLVLTGLVIVSGYTSINAVVKAELFPAPIRALGVGLPYALTTALFGGTAEYIALWARNAGNESWFGWYVTACIFVSLLVYLFMPDTAKRSLIEAEVEEHSLPTGGYDETKPIGVTTP